MVLGCDPRRQELRGTQSLCEEASGQQEAGGIAPDGILSPAQQAQSQEDLGQAPGQGRKSLLPRAATCPSCRPRTGRHLSCSHSPSPKRVQEGQVLESRLLPPESVPCAPACCGACGWSLTGHGKAWPQLRAGGPVTSLREVRGVDHSQPVWDGSGRGALGGAAPSEASFWNH